MYPSVMQLFWERLKRATQTESFLESAIAITERVYRDISDWYLPSYQIDVNEAQRHQIQRVLNAFTFGNPQLLIQQIALSRTLAGEVVGQEGNADVRRGPNANQHSEIQLIGEQSVREISAEMQQVYRDIKQTLGCTDCELRLPGISAMVCVFPASMGRHQALAGATGISASQAGYCPQSRGRCQSSVSCCCDR
jgi:hypothetical protein